MVFHRKNKSTNHGLNIYKKDLVKRIKFSVLGLEVLECRMNPTSIEGMDLLDYASGSQALSNSESVSTHQLSAWRNHGPDANSWKTNTVQSSNAIFSDNAAIPFRWISTISDDAQGNDFQEGTVYTVRLEWTFSGGINSPGQLFIDYLTTYNATESASGPFPASFTGGSNSTISIPTDPDSSVKGQTGGVFNLYNIDSKNLQFTSGSVSDRYVEIAINNNESHKYIDIQFTPDDGDTTPNEKLNVGIAWGGHLATETVHGINNGSSDFPGASTTMSVDFDPSSKGDVSTININSNNAIVPQGSITIVMDSLPNSLQDFTFMASGSVSSVIPTSFTLDDDNGVVGADSTYSNSIVFFGLTDGTYTFTENLVSGWTLSSLTATENGASDTTASDIFTSNLGTRTLTITLANGEAWTGTFSNTVIANSPPVVTTNIGVTAFTEGNNVTSIPIIVDAVITVTDSDNATLSTGAVSITGNFQATEDVLAFINVPATMGNIVGIYNAGTGVLSLSSTGATATLAQWQEVLRSITYTNSSNTPNTLTRTVSFRVNDGTNASTLATKQISIAAVNDAPIAMNDSYTTNEDTLLSVATLGVLANDTDADGNPLTSILVSGPSHGSLILNADGSFSYTPNLNYNGSDSFTYKANDGLLDSALIEVSLTITAVVPVVVVSVPVPVVSVVEVPVVEVPAPVVTIVPPITQAPLIFPYATPVNVALGINSNAVPNEYTAPSGAINYLATGTSPGDGVRFGAGGVSGTNTNIQSARTNNTAGSVLSFPGFNGEVRVAHADFNNDGILDIVVAKGPGGRPDVRVINGATGSELGSFFAFAPTFTGGVFVAAADVNGDGLAEIVVGAGPGGGPNVKVFDGRTFAVKESFFAYDPSFRGGVSVAVFDFNNDGFNEIVTGAGAGGSPHVKVFDGSSLRVIKEFMAYALTFRGGVYVAAGDFNSDLVPDIITGAGAGGGPHVKDWNYNTLEVLDSTMAFDNFTKADGTVIDQLFSGGVRVAIACGGIDCKQNLIVGAGPGGGPHVKVYYKGDSLSQLFSYFSGDQSNNQGVFVS